jgi:hypothetical protein
MADRGVKTVVHLVGSVPLADSESVFRTLSRGVGNFLTRLPDGETGIRKSWIRFLQDVLAQHPAIEVAHDLPPFKFTQWDGKVVREIPRLRVKKGASVDAAGFKTGYADMAIESFAVFDKLQKGGVIPAGVRFQVSIPSPLAPTYNNILPSDRPAVIPGLTRHFIGEIESIARAIPNDRVAIQWDVCQEVLAWHDYYEPGPVDFKVETIEVLRQIGEGVPAGIELGYHLCYGSPADEHMVLPKDAGVMVEMTNRIAAAVKRPIQFFHLPVMKNRKDDEFFAPLAKLKIAANTQLYLGLIHHNDAAGDDARLAAARKFTRVDGIGTECGWARGDPTRVESFLAAHARLAGGG